MGLFLRIALLVLMLVAIGFGAWIIAIPIALYIVLSLFSRKKSRMVIVVERPSQPGHVTSASSSSVPKRALLGISLLLLALVARYSGGVWSPVVLASGGLLVLLSSKIASFEWFGRVDAVENSILLRRRNLPLQWISVAEVKLATTHVMRALATLSDELVIRGDEGTTSLYLVLRGFAATEGMAENQFLERMRRINRVTARRGAFLLPLDGQQASQRLRVDAEPVKVDDADWGVSLEAAPAEMVVLSVAGGFVEAAGVYSVDEKAADRSRIFSARQKFKKKPLLWETLQTIGNKFDWPQSDYIASFLGSLFAAREEPIGALLEGAEGKEKGKTTVSVKAFSSVPVELSRVQLRALALIYGAAAN